MIKLQMKKTEPVIAIFLIFLLLNACGTIAEGLGGSKKKGSDEFLIKKKAPLVLPPNFGELPEPKKKIDENLRVITENSLTIEEIIRQSSSTETNTEGSEITSSIEKSIIKKIQEVNLNEINEIEKVKKEIPKKKGFFKKLREKLNKTEQ